MDVPSPDGSRRFELRPILATVAILALLTGMAVISGCGGNAESSLNGMTRQPPIDVADVSLPQENPRREAPGDRLRGTGDGLMLVFFGYTFCPDVCPTTLADLRLALADLDPEQRRRIEVGMVTVDPARDTPKALNRYLAHFFPAERYAAFVPGSEAELGAVERAFGASHRLGEPDENGNYPVEHSAQVFAVDADGTVLVEWPFGDDPDNVTADIRSLLDRIDRQDDESDDR